MENFLNILRTPYRFIIVFDIADTFEDSFWELLFYLIKTQKATTCNDLKMVVMNIPHDKFELVQHVSQLKTMIENAIPEDLVPFDFELEALHLIEHSGLISEQIELVNELMAIKMAIGIS